MGVRVAPLSPCLTGALPLVRHLALALIAICLASAAAAEPVVRLIYLVPADRPALPAYTAAVSHAARHLQGWYQEALDGQTFALRSPVVEVVRSSQDSEWFRSHPGGRDFSLWFWDNSVAEIRRLLGAHDNDPQNTWVVYLDADPECGQATGATSGIALLPANDLRGVAGIPRPPRCGEPTDSFDTCRWIGGLGHELGHALGLPHPSGCEDNDPTTPCAATALMWLGYLTYPDAFLSSTDLATLRSNRFAQATVARRSLSCAAPTLHVETPNTASRWGIGTRQRLAWLYDGDAPQFLIEVDRSGDAGESWDLLAIVPNRDGPSQNFYWTVTGPSTSNAHLRVTAVGDAAASDSNDAPIRIADAAMAFVLPTAVSVTRTGATETVFYTHNLGAARPVAIDVSSDDGSSWRTVAASTLTRGAGTSSFRWAVGLLPTARARLRLRALDGSGAIAVSPRFAVSGGAAGTLAGVAAGPPGAADASMTGVRPPATGP